MLTKKRAQASVLLLALFAVTGSVSLLEAAEPARPVSTPARPAASGAEGTFTPSFSADGRFVVFVSQANNLATNDNLARFLDVFVRDLTTSNTTLVSVNGSGIGGGNENSTGPTLSSNGQFVAFQSEAANLASNDTNGASDVFVRDLVASTTTLVSVNTAGATSGNGVSITPLISADGRRVFFESTATNLVDNDANGTNDVFMRDLQSGTTTLISVNTSGTHSANGKSELCDITPDGRLVAFISTATDSVDNATNRLSEIYVRDSQSRATHWVSSNVAGYFPAVPNAYRCFNAALSADGRTVTFKVQTPDANSALLFRHDLQTGQSTVLTSNALVNTLPAISGDGRYVAYESASANSTNVYLWDSQTESNLLISVNLDGTAPANAPSHTPVLTPDGQYVVFLSTATDLATNATNGVSQVYARDLVTGITRLVSANLNGAASAHDIEVTLPAISADGRMVLFESLADDLAPDDSNQASDVFLRNLSADTTQLVSQRHPSLPGVTGAARSSMGANVMAYFGYYSTRPLGLPPVRPGANSISVDGRFILFSSWDNNLVPNDTNALQDVFVRDLLLGTNLPVSVVPEVVQVDTGQVITNAVFQSKREGLDPTINASGRYVAYVWRTNLPGGYQRDVYVADLQSGTNALVSRKRPGPSSATTGTSDSPTITSNGEWIAFQSGSTELIDYLNFSSSFTNVYVRNILAGTNQLVSINRSGTGASNGHSTEPLVSPDGRWVVFGSTSSDLTTNNTAGFRSLFARDLAANTTYLVSVGPDGNSQWGYRRGAVFSADSHFVAFVSDNVILTVNCLRTHTSTVVCSSCDNPSLSSDGRFVAYETPSSGVGPKNIVVQDLQTGVTNLISVNRAGTGGGNGHSTMPLISGDGRFVVFESLASDLVDNDDNNAKDIFVRDRVLGTTLLLSLSLSGHSGNRLSSRPALGPDGRTVVFQSFASDLVPGDFNDQRDVFVLRIGSPDTDGDGMDDDWEVAYFGDLSHDGTADSDGDGLTDLEEFRAGTNPTSDVSVLRAMTLTSLSGSGTTILWSAAPGRTYQVQYKDDLNDPGWTSLPGIVTANGSTASTSDNSATGRPQRFYRVVLAP